MNKIKYVLIFIFLYFVFNIGVSAETYKCEYKFGEDESYIFEFDNTNGTFKNLTEKEDKSSPIGTIHNFKYNYEYHFITKEITTYKVNTCPVLYVAEVEDAEILSDTLTNTYHIYSDAFLRENDGYKCVTGFDLDCIGNLFSLKFTSFKEMRLDKDSEINKNNTEVSVCPSYKLIDGELQDALDNQKKCSGQDCIKFKTTANEKLKQLKETCNNILSYRDYFIDTGNQDDSETSEENEEETNENVDSNGELRDACVVACLEDLPDRIEEIEGNKNDTGECGFSGRLMVWFSNILRWIKYLLPVAVIVLAILDFIKAIGADKDDEMKKAQGRFVKRLIAAALVFIIPLIIEFVLDKMGFGYDDCGLF